MTTAVDNFAVCLRSFEPAETSACSTKLLCARNPQSDLHEMIGPKDYMGKELGTFPRTRAALEKGSNKL